MQKSVPTPSWASFISFLMDMNNFIEHEHQKGHWMHKMDQNKNCVISLTKVRQIRTLSKSQTDPPLPILLAYVSVAFFITEILMSLSALPSFWKRGLEVVQHRVSVSEGI